MTRLRRSTPIRDEIARLDPAVDYDRITHLVSEGRFGWPPIAAAFYTVTFVRQAAVPSIARLLHRGGTGPSVTDVRRRNDDTLVIFGEIFAHGAASERGRATIDRLQEIHGQFRISQDDYRYTLCSIIDEPQRGGERVGVRTMSRSEDEARFRFWVAVGERMGITDLPATYEEALAHARDYERRHWATTLEGTAVATSVVEDYVRRYLPPLAVPLGVHLVHALLGPELCRVHGYRVPGRVATAVTLGALRAYLLAKRVLPDAPVRPVTASFGQAYGACPHLPDVGYRREPTGRSGPGRHASPPGPRPVSEVGDRVGP